MTQPQAGVCALAAVADGDEEEEEEEAMAPSRTPSEWRPQIVLSVPGRVRASGREVVVSASDEWGEGGRSARAGERERAATHARGTR